MCPRYTLRETDNSSQAAGISGVGTRISIDFVSATGVLLVNGDGGAIGIEVVAPLTLAAGSSATFDGTVSPLFMLLLTHAAFSSPGTN